MDVGGGEKLDHLVENFLQEFIGHRYGRVQRIVGIALNVMIAVGRFLTVGEFGQCNERCRIVTGNVDLGNDLDTQRTGMISSRKASSASMAARKSARTNGASLFRR